MKKVNKEYLPFISTSRETTLRNKTGDWRTQKPVLERKPSPCANACPLGNDIPHWISLIKQREYRRAWEALIEQNPLPAVTGRVCQAFCQESCNRSQFDEGISIKALEKFLGDEAMGHAWKAQPIGRPESFKVAVIGSGPAGLSCAYQLARRGYKVTIFEALSVMGGMLRVGIPEYRLPKTILSQEVAYNILSLGVEVKTGIRIGENLSLKELKDKFDAVFIATGAHKSRKLNIPGENLERVISGLDFLKKINLGESLSIGKRVAVIGGGNTAIDSARSAHLLGAHVSLVYRRTKEDMPAFKEEIEAAEKEGIEFYFLLKPVAIIPEQGKIKRMECVEGKIEGKDRDGRSRVLFPNKEPTFSIAIDNVIAAVGEEPDLSFLPKNLPEKVFIGGDARLPSPAAQAAGGQAQNVAGTVAAAIGSGREAAQKIERMLLGGSQEEPKNLPVVQFSDLNLAYFKHQKRIKNVSSGVSAQREAKRCFSCGWCNMCRNCQVFCPDVAIFEKNGEYQINYDYCKGCGICAEECPTKSISLWLEQKED